MKKDKALRKQENAEKMVVARSGLGLAAGLVVIWLVLRWIRHG